jgi:hypothetical protein
LSGMKSFRDVLNGRMRTGKGRFVLASVTCVYSIIIHAGKGGRGS